MKAYIALLSEIIGSEISARQAVNDDINRLEAECGKFNSMLKLSGNDEMHVALPPSDDIQEPCPICSSSVDKKAKLAWIGLNPHKDSPQFKQYTTWLYLEDYHCCNAEADGNNVFKYVSGQTGFRRFSPYYQLIFRFLLSVIGGKAVENVRELKEQAEAAGKTMGEHFLSTITDNPIICAELFPFKTDKFPTNAKLISALVADDHYGNYLDSLLDVIFDNVSTDWYVVFFGATGATADILKKNGLKLPQPVTVGGQKFIFFKHKGCRVIISPFIQPGRSKNYDLVDLMAAINSHVW